MGLWLTGETLTQHIHNAFKNLFQASSSNYRTTPGNERRYCPNSPFRTQAQLLIRIPQPDEILLEGSTEEIYF